MAHTVMACIVIVMAYMAEPKFTRKHVRARVYTHECVRHVHACARAGGRAGWPASLYSYGVYSYGVYSYGPI